MSAWAWLGAAVLTLYLATAWWHTRKPLPPGLGVEGSWREPIAPRLLLDETFVDAHGKRHCRQQIFDEMFRLIGQAERLVVLDIFQFNDPADGRHDCHRQISVALRDALLARKRQRPEVEMVIITDPINSVYGGRELSHHRQLEAAGIRVATTDLTMGRDPNPSWTAFWRLCLRWLGNSPRGGWLPNPLGPGKVTLRSYLTLLNLNANHRKTLVVDEGERWTAMVSSANADDGSSDYRDMALRVSGDIALDLLASEREIAARSGVTIDHPQPSATGSDASPRHTPRLRLLSEGAIKRALLAIISDARAGERLDIEVLYLSHRGVIAALARAVAQGVEVRVLLDPNHHAFGVSGSGIPNRQAANDLLAAGIQLRWSDTHGEQAHSKLLLRHGGQRPTRLLLGSANYTRRSLDDLNFEANLEWVADADEPVITAARAAFERHWHNTDAEHYSVGHAVYLDPSRRRYWQYRLMEASGWCTF
ncbi:PLD-like domain-containing protein [Franzmannia pantelleriensis]|uniref:PLD-like domain-containing protein n=1 Tax=Franzmannia pantelleriensis TaxID=48727 RepID=A0A1G9GXF6_9GAMM|nr:phospholipase D-like domain-containing protein [Halomonas pantelleriensis]SDL05346.1 PLD-like domain-containing protein [Halomonas pantelleriensis]